MIFAVFRSLPGRNPHTSKPRKCSHELLWRLNFWQLCWNLKQAWESYNRQKLFINIFTIYGCVLFIWIFSMCYDLWAVCLLFIIKESLGMHQDFSVHFLVALLQKCWFPTDLAFPRSVSTPHHWARDHWSWKMLK